MSAERPRPVKVVAYPDGPYLVRGEFEILDAKGTPVEVRRKTVALCRCGLSQIKPFCDGTHVSAGFKAR
jgi:CDGSH-type Zn-finger protein